MVSRVLFAAVFSLALLGPSAALAQEVVIAHDEVKCIVAGKFPKMGACFTPAGRVGKARVYFRPETLPSWFYVEMKADEACHAGVLPKPSKALVDKKIFYYVDVQGEGTARTQEYAPVVVEREADCKNLPAAPAAATGPAAVYPSLPAGFVGAGISTTVVAAGVAGILVTGGGSVLPGGDDDAGRPIASQPTPPPATTPPTTPTPTTTPATPPTSVTSLVVACEATPRSGESPLRVEFATFPAGGTGAYEFLWSFGDGEFSPNPNPAHVFRDDGVYDATVRVTSGEQVVLCTRRITVARRPEPTPSPTPSTGPTPIPSTFKLQVIATGGGTVTGPGINCPTDCEEDFPPGTVVTLNATPSTAPPTRFRDWTGHCTGSGPCVVTMDSNRNVVAHFERVWILTIQGGGNSDISGEVHSNPPGGDCVWPPSCTDTAGFVNNTVVTLGVSTAGATIVWGGACSGASGTICTLVMDADKTVTVNTRILLQGGTKPSDTQLRFTSHLELVDVEGHVVTNGQAGPPVRTGVFPVAGASRAGTNRVEAALVRGTGKPGVWRFDFGGQRSFDPGSLRVVAGTVAMLSADTIAFQLQGRPGERIVFTFDTRQ